MGASANRINHMNFKFRQGFLTIKKETTGPALFLHKRAGTELGSTVIKQQQVKLGSRSHRVVYCTCSFKKKKSFLTPKISSSTNEEISTLFLDKVLFN